MEPASCFGNLTFAKLFSKARYSQIDSIPSSGKIVTGRRFVVISISIQRTWNDAIPAVIN